MMSVIFQSLLLCWYFLSLYLVAKDHTVGLYLKIVMEMVNLLCICFIANNLFNLVQYKGIAYYVVYYSIALVLLMWYMYYTPLDISNPGYSLQEKIIYVCVDIITIIYLIVSMFNVNLMFTLNKINTVYGVLKTGGIKCLELINTIC